MSQAKDYRQTSSTCLSGGVEGGDLLFEHIAASAGHEVVNYGFQGMKSVVPYTMLSSEDLQEANVHIERASACTKRNAPKKNYVRKLIRRNYYQVSTVQSIYAVTRWNLADHQAGTTEEGRRGGGTGWVVAIGIVLGVPNMYLFAIEKEQWYKYNYGILTWEKIEAAVVLTPRERYACIDSRDLGA